MSTHPIDVRPLARLARIHLQESEIAPLGASVARVVQWVSQLEHVQLPETVSMDQRQVVMQADCVQASLDRSDVLANAPLQEKGFFCVPKILEQAKDA